MTFNHYNLCSCLETNVGSCWIRIRYKSIIMWKCLAQLFQVEQSNFESWNKSSFKENCQYLNPLLASPAISHFCQSRCRSTFLTMLWINSSLAMMWNQYFMEIEVGIFTGFQRRQNGFLWFLFLVQIKLRWILENKCSTLLKISVEIIKSYAVLGWFFLYFCSNCKFL